MTAPTAPRNLHPTDSTAALTRTDERRGVASWMFPAAGVLRILTGFVFLWAFFDKLFGLGVGTEPGKSVLNGGSPTTRFLTHAVPAGNPLTGVWNALVSINPFTDILFMAGLLGIGAALMLGIGMKVATISGVAMYLFMALAAYPFGTNPFVDDHVLMALVLIVLLGVGAQDHLGFGRKWAQIVGEDSWLR
ncbi:hypothetical protein [Helcobacillus massiliensis]|uniref:Thiosulfate dehydrogenase [quinone] large subunit n=1 Tax=Helcobacillus massiliensis TaxID=521392 RepID=A0A839QQ39_9MICO|nr:hypothetical protein [Helcobacillus massiliensis]MBB3022613.1 thiosulfate dehydrogenase [quinone] large subunit [Helcobacillus massiliensis]